MSRKLEQTRRVIGGQFGGGEVGDFSPAFGAWITDVVDWMISSAPALTSAFLSPVIIYSLVTSSALV